MGDSGVDVLKKFPHLSWVYQDLEPVIDTLRAVSSCYLQRIYANIPTELLQRLETAG